MKDISGKIKKFYQRQSGLSKFAWFILIALIIVAVFAKQLSSYSPHEIVGPALSPPSKTHLMGTDDLGMDIWSQICFGARSSLFVGLSTALIAGLGGGVLGIVAGYRQGIFDLILMRLADMVLALPRLPLLIVMASFFGPSTKHIVLMLALFSWPGPARILRSETLSLKERNYVKMSQFVGANTGWVLQKHFLPSLMPLLSISVIRISGKAIVSEASLAFLGLGDPTGKSWGLIINHATSFPGLYFTDFWKWWLLFPLIFLLLLVCSLAFIARGLEANELKR